MGSVQFGIPRQLALALKAKHRLVRFVETGTLVADTAVWASDHFTCVTTVDIEPHPDAASKIKAHDNIVSFFGDSARFLETSYYDNPTLFWLDAHTNESCPVLREIAAINKYPNHNVILVDDARLFGDLPAWPTLKEVCVALQDNGRRVTEIIEDVIVATPCP